jgi:hypothetical protein
MKFELQPRRPDSMAGTLTGSRLFHTAMPVADDAPRNAHARR